LPTNQDIMTAEKFRRLALAIPGALESEHMGHPDFRIAGKIFATLHYPDDTWGMVKLTPEQQQSFVQELPNVFNPCNGVWGQRGATNVHLPSVTAKALRAALGAAWRNVLPQTPTRPRSVSAKKRPRRPAP